MNGCGGTSLQKLLAAQAKLASAALPRSCSLEALLAHRRLFMAGQPRRCIWQRGHVSRRLWPWGGAEMAAHTRARARRAALLEGNA